MLKNKELCALDGGFGTVRDGGETKKWWPETGLNRRRRPFQGRALPLSYLASVQTAVAISCADSDIAGEKVNSTISLLQQLVQYTNYPLPRQTRPANLGNCMSLFC